MAYNLCIVLFGGCSFLHTLELVCHFDLNFGIIQRFLANQMTGNALLNVLAFSSCLIRHCFEFNYFYTVNLRG